MEFTLILLPLLAILFTLLDTAWAIFAKSTLQQAVRNGVRSGITITSLQATGGQCMTDMVKSTVQGDARGLLNGTAGMAKIKVHYFAPPAPNSTGPVTDVSTLGSGNTPGNIMQVSVENYSLMPLLPRIFSWKVKADRTPMNITVYSADAIEPSRNPPCIGSAP
jgi:Flp pilus assembly protein TadG